MEEDQERVGPWRPREENMDVGEQSHQLCGKLGLVAAGGGWRMRPLDFLLRAVPVRMRARACTEFKEGRRRLELVSVDLSCPLQ